MSNLPAIRIPQLSPLPFLLLVSLLPFQAELARGDQRIGQQVEDFTLRDFRGKPVSLSDFADQRLVVIAFLGTECPLAKLYGPRLVRLADEFADDEVVFLGVNSNLQDSITEISAYARIHKIDFPLLKDAGNRVADQVKAERTPEVFLLDRQRRVRYWGRIDDQYGIGYIRDEPTRHDLKIAIEELLAGKPVSLPNAKSVGCHIGRIPKPNLQSSVTYSEHIAPLLQRHCVDCHRKGEIAPFALTDYDEVVGWAPMIAEVVKQNRMPPWHANPEHGSFENDCSLSQDEKQLVFQWVDEGAPEGDPAKLPPLREFTEGWQLPQKPDQVVYMRTTPFSVPAEGVVQYKYFTADPGFEENKWLKAIEVVPGNRAVVHHVLVFVKTTHSRFGNMDGYLGAYVPGMRAAPFPDGMAKFVPAGAKLYFQLHYTPVGSPQEDNSYIGLVFADRDQVTHVVKTASAWTKRIAIPAHDDSFSLEATSGSEQVDVKLLSMLPHMHLRGKSFRYETRPPNGSGKVLLDVPAYDFNWQTEYRCETPITIPAGTRIHCTAVYDNSENNLANPNPDEVVRFGPQTWDEMMFGYFDYAVPIAEFERPAKALIGALDRNGNSVIESREIPRPLVRLFTQVDRDRNGNIGLDQILAAPSTVLAKLGTVLRQ